MEETNVRDMVMSNNVDDWLLTRLSQGAGECGRPVDQACTALPLGPGGDTDTLTGEDLVKKQTEDGVVVKIYSAEAVTRVGSAPMAFATFRPGKPPWSGRSFGQDAAPVLFAVRWITPESTVSPTREIV